ncbi:limonene-1,2-epoxide hydrolase family protein [Herbihabitans rhizosphaerae]|uniref:limonene-1,2-epoxide hydrolase family protein n=1 Tax=Herbihabitans rhizosphaerae TaxID=1872711 RepID=UPI001A9389E3|nr:limonene-1,2-epoxide hydrolase family protein [Herbihabitans rhizosphaerae]
MNSDAGSAPPADAIGIVASFLSALEDNDLAAALDLLAEDAQWINVSLPAVRGRDRIARLLRLLIAARVGFRVHVHHAAAEGGVVLTERTDALGRGRFEHRFWVYGRFEIEDGRITVWRDSFDWLDIVVGLVRAVAGVAMPGVNRRWPGERAVRR